jgi:hypothetical protein
MASDKYFRHLAFLASPPTPPIFEPVAGADPQLRHETDIAWVDDFDPASVPYLRERVCLTHGRDKRGLRFFKLVGWSCLSADAPDESQRGMPGYFMRRNFWLARGDPLPAGAKLDAECVDPKSIRPGFFGTPIQAAPEEFPSH